MIRLLLLGLVLAAPLQSGDALPHLRMPSPDFNLIPIPAQTTAEARQRAPHGHDIAGRKLQADTSAQLEAQAKAAVAGVDPVKAMQASQHESQLDPKLLASIQALTDEISQLPDTEGILKSKPLSIQVQRWKKFRDSEMAKAADWESRLNSLNLQAGHSSLRLSLDGLANQIWLHWESVLDLSLAITEKAASGQIKHASPPQKP